MVKAISLVTEVYKITQAFPTTGIYALTSQIRRCAISIPGNKAEGYGRNSTADYKRFLQIAVGSLLELQTQIETAFNLNYISKNIFDNFFESQKSSTECQYLLLKK